MAQSKGFGGNKTRFQHVLPEGSTDDRLWSERFAEHYAGKRSEATDRLLKRRERDGKARSRRATKALPKPVYVEPSAEEIARIVVERDQHHERRAEINAHFEQERRAEQLLEWTKERKQAVAQRLKDGFVWEGGPFGGETYNDGYFRPPFTMKGFRSAEHPILQLFVQKVHRAAKGLKVGRLKSAIHGCQSKCVALDMPTITFNEVMRGVWRVDVDGTFPSTGAIYEALARLKAPWPNLVVGLKDEEGRWLKPHFYYVLGDSVPFTAAANPVHMKLFEAIGRGLVHALLRVGADPGGLSNPNRGKNPISPLWDIEVVRDEPWSMDELKDKVNLNVSVAHLHRLAAEMLEPVITLKDGRKIPSNSFFTCLQEQAFETVRPHYMAGADGYEAFRAELILYAIGLCGEFGRVKEKTLKAVAQRVADFTWANFRPDAKPHKVRLGRGKLYKEVEGKTIEERRVLGGKSSAADVHNKAVAAFVAAYERMVADGRIVAGGWPKAIVLAKEAGKTAKTLANHHNEILEAIASKLQKPAADRILGLRKTESRCIDKKLAPRVAEGGHCPVPDVLPVLRGEQPSQAAGTVVGVDLIFDVCGAPVPPVFLRRPRVAVLAQPDSPASRHLGLGGGGGGRSSTLLLFSSLQDLEISLP